MKNDKKTSSLVVLFIDDEPTQHLVMDKVLSPLGVMVIHANSVQEGVDKLKTVQVNLILTDIHMEGMDGLSFLAVLKKDRKLNKIPVVVVTGDTSSEKSKLAYDQGAVGFVTKPVQQDDMAHVVRTFAAFGDTYETTEDTDEFYLRKKHKLTTTLAKDSLERNFPKAMSNYLTGLKDIYDFSVIGYYEKNTDGSFSLVTESGDILLMEDLRTVFPATYPQVTRLISEADEVFSNDLLRTPSPLLKVWANHYSLVSEVLLPFFRVDDRAFAVGAGSKRKNLDMTGFFWGFRSSIFSTREADFIKRLSDQANPILYTLLSASKR